MSISSSKDELLAFPTFALSVMRMLTEKKISAARNLSF